MQGSSTLNGPWPTSNFDLHKLDSALGKGSRHARNAAKVPRSPGIWDPALAKSSSASRALWQIDLSLGKQIGLPDPRVGARSTTHVAARGWGWQ